MKDKVILITGSSRGLGRAIAESFLAESSYVVVTGRNPATVDATARELLEKYGIGRVVPFTGDLTAEEAIQKCVATTIAHFGRIDVLVANIGSGQGTKEWNVSESDWSAMMDLNFNAARRVTNAVVPNMMQNRSGTIVYISSIAGIESIGAPIHYSVAKGALITLGKELSRRVASSNIRVNIVCPGNIYFEGGTWDIKIRENNEKVVEMLQSSVPMKRFAKPEEIASLIVFLGSSRASFITGACIVIDGGQTVSV